MAAHQAPLSLGFSRQEPWSGLPFHSPMHESEKWKWSRDPMDCSLPGSSVHWIFQARVLEWVASAFSENSHLEQLKIAVTFIYSVIIHNYSSLLGWIVLLMVAYKSAMLYTSKLAPGTSWMVQWLGLCTSTARDVGSIPGWGIKFPHSLKCGQKNLTREI